MLDLLVCEHLVDRIDRPAWHANRIEYVDPLGTALVNRALVDLRIQRSGVSIELQSRSHITCPVEQMLMWPSLVLNTPVGMLVG